MRQIRQLSPVGWAVPTDLWIYSFFGYYNASEISDVGWAVPTDLWIYSFSGYYDVSEIGWLRFLISLTVTEPIGFVITFFHPTMETRPGPGMWTTR